MSLTGLDWTRLDSVGVYAALADTRVRKLKGKRDDNKGVYFVIKFLTEPDTIN